MSNVISEMIQRHLGEEVTVFYMTEVSDCDNGVLVECNESCLVLERRDNMDLLIPISSIRMVMTKRDGRKDKRTLPRPAGGSGQGE